MAPDAGTNTRSLVDYDGIRRAPDYVGPGRQCPSQDTVNVCGVLAPAGSLIFRMEYPREVAPAQTEKITIARGTPSVEYRGYAYYVGNPSVPNPNFKTRDFAVTMGPFGGSSTFVAGAVVTYGIPRPDVCPASASQPDCPNVGFKYAEHE